MGQLNTPAPDTAESADGGSSGHRILVVDDNNAAALTLSWGLDILGFDVKICHDGPSALETANDFLPELVLLDIGMPGMNGYEVCRQLRENDKLGKTKIVAQTGWSHVEFVRRAQEVGFDDYLVKPIDLGGLHKAITELLGMAAV